MVVTSTSTSRGTSFRPKRVTDPLDHRAIARLIGGTDHLSYSSSGSDHSAVQDAADSPCLSHLVQGFLEEEADDQATNQSNYDSDSAEPADSASDFADSISEIAFGGVDPFRSLLASQVAKAAEAFSHLREQRPLFRRKVMSFLRESGHNAGICKTRWDSSGGLTSGCYEFVDVVVVAVGGNTRRYVVDLDFASQFEIARPTAGYVRLLECLPTAFVGRVEDVKRMVRTMSEAARRSLKSRELSLPPWRKNRYMVNKWMGPYRRTVNSAAGTTLPDVIGAAAGVQCRFVGFDDGVGGRLAVRT